MYIKKKEEQICDGASTAWCTIVFTINQPHPHLAVRDASIQVYKFWNTNLNTEHLLQVTMDVLTPRSLPGQMPHADLGALPTFLV